MLVLVVVPDTRDLTVAFICLIFLQREKKGGAFDSSDRLLPFKHRLRNVTLCARRADAQKLPPYGL
jgi:hypothetical protein